MQESETEFQPEIVIRASSLSELFDCGARWEAKYLRGMRIPSGGAAVIGTAVHKGTAVFDSARLTTEPPSIEEAIATAADAVRKPEQEVRWDDFRPSEAVDIAAKLTMNYCNDIAPGFTYRKVEMKLNAFDVVAENGVKMRFTGHVDRQYTQQLQPDMETAYGTLDFKTGKQVVKADGSVNVAISAAQLGTYELLELMASKTELVPHVLPAMIIAMPTAGKHQPQIKKVNNPRSLLIGNEQHKGLIDIAAQIYKHGLFVGNPRSMLCGEKYCPAYGNCHWRLTGE
jgi:hypothetical protein